MASPVPEKESLMKLLARAKRLLLGVVVSAVLTGGAGAQIPVTVTSDVPATMHQIETIMKWTEQLRSMSDQLDQMRQVYGTLQGMRNLGSLMNNDLLTQYLPQDYVGSVKALRSGGGSFK
jgi:type IV secretion system protein VirB5